MTPVRDAATVLVGRDGAAGLEVFLVRRHARSSWLADLFVFPGGGVEPADRDPAVLARVRGTAGEVDPAFAVTAARETFEEGGLLFADRRIDPHELGAARRALLAGEIGFGDVLARFDAALDASQLRYFSRWVTPEGEPRRFDARFFVARVPYDQIAEADAVEVLDGRWFRPRDALDAHARGEIGMIFPTVKHLERIAPYRNVDDLLAFAQAKSITIVRPHFDDAGALAMAPELVDVW